MIAALSLGGVASTAAAEVKVLTAGAFKQVVLALVPDFEKQTGNKVVVANDTAGGLKKRIEGGEAFDVAVITSSYVWIKMVNYDRGQHSGVQAGTESTRRTKGELDRRSPRAMIRGK
jgi:ABC-type molybdate transport system substrate-binding protein